MSEQQPDRELSQPDPPNLSEAEKRRLVRAKAQQLQDQIRASVERQNHLRMRHRLDQQDQQN